MLYKLTIFVDDKKKPKFYGYKTSQIITLTIVPKTVSRVCSLLFGWCDTFVSNYKRVTNKNNTSTVAVRLLLSKLRNLRVNLQELDLDTCVVFSLLHFYVFQMNDLLYIATSYSLIL